MRLVVAGILVVILLALLGLAILRMVYPPPVPADRSSTALPPATHGPLAEGLRPLLEANPGLTGILPLSEGVDAFIARLALVRAATTAIDARYYIWHRDMTGLVLMRELLAAAERGVKVRLLVDDNGTPGYDAELAAFARHPNMDVRIFNPFMMRQPRLLNYAFDFFRLNRRMHNKSLTVDGLATIVGGRNVGDEYFAAGDSLFVDLDVLAVGDAVGAVTRDFDDYWASPSAIPADTVLGAGHASTDGLLRDADRQLKAQAFMDYRQALAESGLIRRMAAGEDIFRWRKARLHSDDPAKGQGPVPEDRLLIARLFEGIGEPATSLNLVSPYFIPGRIGAAALTDWADRGVRVAVLTNSLEATDVTAVHAGYAKYRKDLLKAGIGLFELRRETGVPGGRGRLGLSGSSASSLHAKTFSVDGRNIFVGSFNFDPRSALLNCEMGLVIEDAALAGELDKAFGDTVPAADWAVSLEEGDTLLWHGEEKGRTVTRDDEPGGSLMRSVMLTVIGWLPVEWLL